MNTDKKAMGISELGNRRGFLRSMLIAAGGAALAALPACSGAAGDDGPSGALPREVRSTSVPLRVRPGLRYQNTPPVRIPAVRMAATATL
jgi:hypothetical protein